MRNNQNRINQLNEFCKTIGFEFHNIEILDIAFTHRSYVNENTETTPTHNERLEFLGDAVIELITSEHLFRTYPNRPEGELTSFRSAAVRTESLADIAKSLNYGEYLKMSKGEELTGGRQKDYLLANCFEAVIGAIYIDQGMAKAKEFVDKYLTVRFSNIVDNRLDIDMKSKFQEIAQAVLKQTPYYKVLKEEGPDHEKVFTVGLYVNDELFGQGQGASKQKAEEASAKDALEKCKSDKRFITA
jgi:ribonuclease-3